MKVSDYFAKLFVAGRLADAGWNVYFPHRVQGFDFMITKTVTNGEMLGEEGNSKDHLRVEFELADV
jgi:hypothetical protein